MMNNLGISPAFRILRPMAITTGSASEVDATVKQHLDELNELLGKGIITKSSNKVGAEDLKKFFEKQLCHKRTSPPAWEPNSIAAICKAEAADDKETLSEHIDRTADLSALKGAFQEYLGANLFSLNMNTRAVLDGYPAIVDYLIARAFYGKYAQEINGLTNFVLNNLAGAKNVIDYAVISSARSIISKDQLKVPNYDKDDSDIVKQLKAAALSVSAASFKTGVHSVVNNFVFNSEQTGWIEKAEATLGKIPEEFKPLLIKYLKNPPVPLDDKNVSYFVALFLSKIKDAEPLVDKTEADFEESDKDFDVLPLEDDQTLIEISRSAVKCAAQLFWGMVLGDELDVFRVVNYFTHKYLIRGGIEIQDGHLRDDLQMYVFSHKFTDLRTKKVVERTRPEERQMFYRQVFNYGNARITNDLILNVEFPKLWKVMILESAKYLERAQESLHPESYVSRQNVMQAVEDLQYNLSTHCTGMANVITPLIYAELNFVIRRIFMHKEVIRQLVPQGGTWWRVVETLYMGMRNVRPKSTVLYNKARLGHEIIRSIAEYSPATFQDDKSFSEFISNVDAFITTQSILQEALTDDLKKGGEDEQGMPHMIPAEANEPAGAVKAGDDEWDF